MATPGFLISETLPLGGPQVKRSSTVRAFSGASLIFFIAFELSNPSTGPSPVGSFPTESRIALRTLI